MGISGRASQFLSHLMQFPAGFPRASLSTSVSLIRITGPSKCPPHGSRWRLNKVIHAKGIDQCMEHTKCPQAVVVKS